MDSLEFLSLSDVIFMKVEEFDMESMEKSKSVSITNDLT